MNRHLILRRGKMNRHLIYRVSWFDGRQCWGLRLMVFGLREMKISGTAVAYDDVAKTLGHLEDSSSTTARAPH